MRQRVTIALAALLKPRILIDNPEPHRFAQGFGGVVLALGVIALLAGAARAGAIFTREFHIPIGQECRGPSRPALN